MDRHFGQELRFISVINGWDFTTNIQDLIRNGGDFHDKQSRFP